MRDYRFSEDWFSDIGISHVLPLGNKEEFHILEIGSYEGKSTTWFLDNLLLSKDSTITCVDPWMNFSQDSNSFNSYNADVTQWSLEKIKEVFLHNILQSGQSDKVIIHQSLSHEALPILITQKKFYDLIYIDGNHTAPFVLTDSVMSWLLLKKGGMIIFDDYYWGSYETEKTLTPKLSIDSFIEVYKDYLEVLSGDDSYRKIIRKK